MGINLLIPVVLLIIIVIGLIIFLLATKNAAGDDKTKNNQKTSNSQKSTAKKSNSPGVKDDNVRKEDVFKFMEFDRILNDMIVQNNGTKYTMVIKCKGINYDLMSEVEQLAVEEGFITFLNTLRYPIQLYVQAQNVDLKKTINLYNKNISVLQQEYNDASVEYNSVVNSLDSTKKDIARVEYNKKSVQNVLEYASDIVKYVERMSLNKNLLQRSFYVIVSYYSSEITSATQFTKEEIVDICYNELYTRVVSIISALSSCSVSGTILDSNGLAELLYNSYNRDDRNYINIKQALESGYYRLYSTSKDAFDKKTELLEKHIENEAQLKAYQALKKAMENGEYVSPEVQQDEINQQISKSAIEIVKSEDVDTKTKEIAKQMIVDDYRKEKKELFKNANKTMNEQVTKLSANEEKEIVGPQVVSNNNSEDVKEIINEQKNYEKINDINIKKTNNDEKKLDKNDDIISNVTNETETTANNVDNIVVSKEETSEKEDKKITKQPSDPLSINDDLVIDNLLKDTNENSVNDENRTEENNSNTSNNNNNNDDNFEDDFFDSII